jgi:CTP:molybdopterin cytidylyltransferase MocA
MDAVVLAGSVNRIPLFPGDRPGRKALVPLLGRPLIAPVLDALIAAQVVGSIVVVGNAEVVDLAAEWPGVRGIAEGETLLANVERGLHAARSEWVLFCNPDQPLLRAPMVDAFATAAVRRDADLVTSWVRRESLGRYHEGAHKFARFGDGVYAHGNLFLVRREFPNLPGARRRIDRLYAARKNVLRFGWEMGPSLFSLFLRARLTGRLPSLPETLDRVGRHFGIRIAAVVGWQPEIALDIDEPEDYAAAQRYLTEGEPGAVVYDPEARG